MTQPSGASALPAGGGTGTPAVAADSSPWAPLAHRAFRWLWIGVLISYVGNWMQMVGAQWLLLDAPNPAVAVALVQAANTVPVMLLALPGGVLADSFDRRWLLFTVQVYFLGVGLLLVVLTVAGEMPPALLLAFTGALAAGTAVQLPTWQAVIPELVPRKELRAATRLEMVGVNLSRAVGPAIAGLVIAWSGVSLVFALNAVSVAFFAVALLFWHRRSSSPESRRERFVPALRTGGRYVWHEPVVRRILLRAGMFIAPAMVLWALLPLVARDQLGLGPGGYGAMFGALGVGAIVAALVLGRVRDHLSTNGLLAAGGLLFALAAALLVEAPNVLAALAILVLAGLAWTTVISTFNAELQLFLPVWVRARGLAVFMVVFTGSQAAGALVWGVVAQRGSLELAFIVAAALVAAGVLAGAVWRVPETGHLDREPAVYWTEPRLDVEPDPEGGPVLITLEFTISRDREEAFLVAMGDLRGSRLRTGANRWELYRDAARRDRFIETFSVPSWEEHLRQHDGRLTAMDQEIEDAALSLSDPPVVAHHLIPPQLLEE